MKNNTYKVGIVGITGITGNKLYNFLFRHPKISDGYLFSETEQGKFFYSKGKFTNNKILPVFDKTTYEICCNDVDIIFLCLPHTVSMKFVNEIYNFSNGKQIPKIIDLSGDFRIKNVSLYEKFYTIKHSCPELITKFVYGLTEIYKPQIIQSQFIANPGCFPTTVILGLAPLIMKQQIEINEIIIDSKSGYSGGGKKLVMEYEGYGGNNTYAYNAFGTHRHIPEIEEQLNFLYSKNKKTLKEIKIIFTPYVVPQYSGMYTTIYLNTNSVLSCEELIDIYTDFYKTELFIRILPINTLPQTKNVINTNYCEIGFAKEQNSPYWIKIFVAIDNLIKGAVGQAVQNMNLMFGIEENCGLE